METKWREHPRWPSRSVLEFLVTGTARLGKLIRQSMSKTSESPIIWYKYQEVSSWALITKRTRSAWAVQLNRVQICKFLSDLWPGSLYSEPKKHEKSIKISRFPVFAHRQCIAMSWQRTEQNPLALSLNIENVRCLRRLSRCWCSTRHNILLEKRIRTYFVGITSARL